MGSWHTECEQVSVQHAVCDEDLNEIERKAREEGRVDVVFPGSVMQDGCCRFVCDLLKCILYQRQQLPMTYDQMVFFQKQQYSSIQVRNKLLWKKSTCLLFYIYFHLLFVYILNSFEKAVLWLFLHCSSKAKQERSFLHISSCIYDHCYPAHIDTLTYTLGLAKVSLTPYLRCYVILSTYVLFPTNLLYTHKSRLWHFSR